MLILTGPPAAGKNTIAVEYVNLSNQCAVVDVDMVRWMLVKPHVAPWGGEEGQKQHRLGVKNACALARNFSEAGFNVLILDVVSEDLAQVYRQSLAFADPKIVRLLPNHEEVIMRNLRRKGKVLKEGEIEFLYRTQLELRSFDHSIDNTSIPAEKVAADLLAL